MATASLKHSTRLRLSRKLNITKQHCNSCDGYFTETDVTTTNRMSLKMTREHFIYAVDQWFWSSIDRLQMVRQIQLFSCSRQLGYNGRNCHDKITHTQSVTFFFSLKHHSCPSNRHHLKSWMITKQCVVFFSLSFLFETKGNSSQRVSWDKRLNLLNCYKMSYDAGKLKMENKAEELQEEGKDANPGHLMLLVDLH